MDGKHRAALHAGTPAVVVRASTAKTALGLRSLRHPDDVRVGSTPRILRDRTVADAVTRTERVFGARPLKRGEGDLIADATTVIALSGQPLLLHTADGDASLTLSDAAGRALWAYNAQKTVTRTWYELAEEGGRPQAVTENSCAGLVRTREYLRYGAWDDAHRRRNLVGAVILHHDNAGTCQTRSAGLTGQVLETHRRLLRVDAQLPDWAGGSEDDLEAQVLTVKASHDAVGAVLEQTNAVNVTTATTYDVSGAVAQTWLGRSVVLKAVVRLADGAPLSQTAGNGVVETYVYAPRSHRLTQHRTARPAGHPQGALVICDQHYAYDPAGNILTLDDQGADPTWYRNAATNGLREYAYDTLYRLVSATGRERSPVRLDPMQPSGRAGGSVWRGYTERYTYDDGDNLTNLSHDGGAGARTRSLVVSASSNRAMVQGHDLTPDTGFLPGGLQKQLADGRQLSWLADNQLQQVRLVSRGTEEADDTERYHYADGGNRTRKVNWVKSAGGIQTTVTTYAGGCEIRQRMLDSQSTLHKDVVITEAGNVRRVADRLSGDYYLRFMFCDHLRSSGGEMDCDGKLVAREEYAPYGGTTGVDEDGVETVTLRQRTCRHAGKERDATGLYYYGWRYYQADVGRWLSADPGGLIDGSNLFRMVQNNPVVLRDENGLAPMKSSSYTSLSPSDMFAHNLANEDGKLIAVGIDELEKKDHAFANNLSRAISASVEGVGFALDVVRKINVAPSSSAQAEMLNSYFFDTYSNERLMLSMGDIDNALAKLKAGLEENVSKNIILVENDSPGGEVSWHSRVTGGDKFFRERIFLNQKHKHNVYQMTWSVMHEVSHLALRTVDMWYVSRMVQGEGGDQGIQAFGSSLDRAVIHQRTLRMSTVEGATLLHPDRDFGKLKHNKFFNAKRPKYTVRALLANADSLVMLVYFINYNFKGPLRAFTSRASDTNSRPYVKTLRRASI